MKKIIFAIVAATIVTLMSCGDSQQNPHGDTAVELTREQRVDSSSKEEAKMRASQNYAPQQAMSALRLYTEFANRFPKDTMTAEYLFRASDIAMGLGDYQQQVDLLEIIIDQHTGYDQYDAACFSAAMTYDEHFEKVNFGADRAIQLYEFVIANYPNSSYAKAAETLKEFVGKPDSVYENYIMGQLEKNNSQ